MMDVEVELLEGRHQLWVFTDLRLARRPLDEVPMRRNLRDEQVRRISQALPSCPPDGNPPTLVTAESSLGNRARSSCSALPLAGAGRPPQGRTVPFDRCPETTSSSAIEPPFGGASTLSSSSAGEPASGATF
jgi:hypothetical protein